MKRQVELLATVYHVTVIHTVSTSDVNNIELEEFKQDHLKEYIIYHPPGKTLFQKRKIQRAALDLGLEKVSYVDLLMTQILLPKGWQFMKVKKNFNCPWIHIEQGSYFRPETRANWSIIEKTIVKRCSKHITSLFAVSEFRMEMFRYILRDYQQFLFVVLAILLALTDVLRRRVYAQPARD